MKQKTFYSTCVAFSFLVMNCAFVSSIIAQSNVRVTSSGPSGVLKGTVMTDKTERPLLNAKISIPILGLSATSDSVGDFRINGVSVGSFDVVVELNGFEPLRSKFNFSDGERIAVDFALSERVVQLKPKTNREKAADNVDISRMGLEERRNVGAGRYITADELAQVKPHEIDKIFVKGVSRLHSVNIGGTARAIASNERDHFVEPSDADKKAGAKADCYVQVLLNGDVMYQSGNGNALYDVNSIPAGIIISFDYFSPATTPPEHRTEGAKCGILQIQTRGR